MNISRRREDKTTENGIETMENGHPGMGRGTAQLQASFTARLAARAAANRADRQVRVAACRASALTEERAPTDTSRRPTAHCSRRSRTKRPRISGKTDSIQSCLGMDPTTERMGSGWDAAIRRSGVAAANDGHHRINRRIDAV